MSEAELLNQCRNLYVSRLRAAERLRAKYDTTPTKSSAGLSEVQSLALSTIRKDLVLVSDSDVQLLRQLLIICDQIVELKKDQRQCEPSTSSFLAPIAGSTSQLDPDTSDTEIPLTPYSAFLDQPDTASLLGSPISLHQKKPFQPIRPSPSVLSLLRASRSERLHSEDFLRDVDRGNDDDDVFIKPLPRSEDSIKIVVDKPDEASKSVIDPSKAAKSLPDNLVNDKESGVTTGHEQKLDHAMQSEAVSQKQPPILPEKLKALPLKSSAAVSSKATSALPAKQPGAQPSKVPSAATPISPETVPGKSPPKTPLKPPAKAPRAFDKNQTEIKKASEFFIAQNDQRFDSLSRKGVPAALKKTTSHNGGDVANIVTVARGNGNYGDASCNSLANSKAETFEKTSGSSDAQHQQDGRKTLSSYVSVYLPESQKLDETDDKTKQQSLSPGSLRLDKNEAKIQTVAKLISPNYVSDNKVSIKKQESKVENTTWPSRSKSGAQVASVVTTKKPPPPPAPAKPSRSTIIECKDQEDSNLLDSGKLCDSQKSLNKTATLKTSEFGSSIDLNVKIEEIKDEKGGRKAVARCQTVPANTARPIIAQLNKNLGETKIILDRKFAWMRESQEESQSTSGENSPVGQGRNLARPLGSNPRLFSPRGQQQQHDKPLRNVAKFNDQFTRSTEKDKEEIKRLMRQQINTVSSAVAQGPEKSSVPQCSSSKNEAEQSVASDLNHKISVDDDDDRFIVVRL